MFHLEKKERYKTFFFNLREKIPKRQSFSATMSNEIQGGKSEAYNLYTIFILCTLF